MDALLGLAVGCSQILFLCVLGYVFRVDRGKGGDSC